MHATPLALRKLPAAAAHQRPPTTLLPHSSVPQICALPSRRFIPCRAVRDDGSDWPSGQASAPAPPLPDQPTTSTNDTAAARAAAQRAAAQVDQVMAEIGRELFVGRAIESLMRKLLTGVNLVTSTRCCGCASPPPSTPHHPSIF